MKSLLKFIASLLLLASGVKAEEQVPVFAVPAAVVSPLPYELALPEVFHQQAVQLNGHLQLTFADISVSARGWPLILARRYSANAPDTGMGPGWAWTFGVSVEQDRNTRTLFFSESDGGVSAYVRSGPEMYQATAGRFDSVLHTLTDGRLRRVYADGSLEIFDRDYRLVRRQGVNGEGYNLIREGSLITQIVHDDGQFFRIIWSNGRVEFVEDMMGRKVGFSYQQGRLSKTVDALNRETGFLYNDKGSLEFVNFVDGSSLTISQDVNGRVNLLSGPGNLETRFDSWGAVEDGRIVQVRIDADGNRYRTEMVRSFTMADQFTVTDTGPDGAQVVRDQRDGQVDIAVNGKWIGGVVLDGAGYPAMLIGENGTVPLPVLGEPDVIYSEPDARGHPQLIATSGGSFWQKSDAVGRVVAIAGEGGRVERFAYDAGDRLLSHLDAEGISTTYEYDLADRPVNWQADDGRWRRFKYTAEGFVSDVAGQAMAPIVYSYDRLGRIAHMQSGQQSFTAAYSQNGGLAALLDDKGLGIHFERDASGKLTGVNDDYGVSVEYDFADGVTLRDELGRVMGMVLDADGVPAFAGIGGALTYTDPLDDGGLLSTTLLPDGQGIVERFDDAGVFVGAEALSDSPYVIETSEVGHVVIAGDPLMPSTISYGEDGLVTEVTDTIGVPTVYEHDEAGRMTSVASPYLGVELIYEGDSSSPVGMRTSEGEVFSQQISADGRTIHYTGTDRNGIVSEEVVEIDVEGRVIRQVADGVVSEISYPDVNTTEISVLNAGRTLVWLEELDPVSNTTTVTRPDGTQVVTGFDKAGRVISTKSPESRTEYEMDPDGLLLAVIADGRRIDMQTGPQVWRVIEEVDVDAGDDGVIRIQTITDPRGNLWQSGYGTDGRALWSKDPLGGITYVERAATGQITRVTDPEGRVQYAEYDDLGRATEVGVLDGWATAFGWEGRDPAGQSRSGGARLWVEPDETSKVYHAMVDGEPWATFRYDVEGRITSAASQIGTINYEYDANGEAIGLTGALGRHIGFKYDTLGRLDTLILPNGDSISYRYSDGNTVIQTGPDGTSTSAVYEPETARFEISASDGSQALISLATGDVLHAVSAQGTDGSSGGLEIMRELDNAVATLTLNGESRSAERDALGRLVSFGTEDEREEWTYDGSGNVLSTPDGLSRNYNIAWQPTVIGDDEFEHDSDGRVIRRGNTHYKYDPLGRLVEVTIGDEITGYEYDANSQLVRRTQGEQIEEYLWFGGQLLAVYDGSGKRIALIENYAAVPNMIRLYMDGESRLLIPNQVGTPMFELSNGHVRTLPEYSAWGEAPDNPEAFARWLGYSGAMSDPSLGLVHTKARVYLPDIQRFAAPDPLGIDNPVNPYSYAAFDPLSYIDRGGLNAHTFNPVGSLGDPGYSPRLGPSGPWSNLHNNIVADLENALSNETRPHIRRSLNDTLQNLRNNGARVDVSPTLGGYGDHANGRIRVNPGMSSTRDPNFRATGSNRYSARAVGGVLGHEGRHYQQLLSEQRNRNTIGRVMKEFDAHLQGSNVERAIGGFQPRGSERRLMQNAIDYAMKTEYRSYLPAGSQGSLSNSFRGTGQPAYNGLRQMTPETILRIARTHMPEVPAHQVLDDFTRTAERWRANPRAEAALRSLGPDAVRARDQMVREARVAAARARTAAITPPRQLPQLSNPPGAQTSAARAATTPNASPRTNVASSATNPRTPPANASPTAPRSQTGGTRATPRATTSPQPGARTTQRLTTPPRPTPTGQVRAPGARVTQRLPAGIRETGGVTARTGPRPSGGNPSASQPSATRPSNTVRSRPATVAEPTAPRQARPPATQKPPTRNTRPLAEPSRPSTRPRSAPNRPRVKLRAPTPTTPSTTPTRSMPTRPTGPGAARPAPGSPRPSARGGRYRIPDLDAGGRVNVPPRNGSGGLNGRPPRTPRGARITTPKGMGLGQGFGKALGILGVAADIYNTDRYIRGEIGHQEYWGGIGLSAAGYLLPYPLNAALAAHSVGGALGSYAANSLLEAARNGDKVAQAILDYLRRSGFINANDPTFIAISESAPPFLRGGGMLLLEDEAQWIAFSVWSIIEADARLVLVGNNGSERELGTVTLRPGSNLQVLPPVTVSDLLPGDYTVFAISPDEAKTKALAIRVVEKPETVQEEPTEFFAETYVIETRIRPSELPWERFDRPDSLLSGLQDEGAEFSGYWNWIDDPNVLGGRAHLTEVDGPPVHAVRFESPIEVMRGENIIQYLWLDPENPPEQVVIQVYDDRYSAAHRLSLGTDVLYFEDTAAYGFVLGGPLPGSGSWTRVRIPVTEIGMDGQSVAGLAFYAAGGSAAFGATRISGGDDTAPRLVLAAGRDISGTPEADLTAVVKVPEPGNLDLSLSLKSGALIPLLNGHVQAGERHFWRQGEAAQIRGARLTGTFEPLTGETVIIDEVVSGNPALVARILYPQQGAVVRQTVPIFGQAGGEGFTEYVVEMRRLGGDEDDWQELIRSETSTVMTDNEIRNRINSILKNELRGTVYGNLASLNTGSALHRFEFSEDAAVMKSGWIELRLRSFDAEGNFAEADTAVRVGEVATGQDKSSFISPDGQAILTLPPFALNLGMGTFSVDLTDPELPPGAPEPAGEVYGFAPEGLAFNTPVTLSIKSESTGAIAIVTTGGNVTLLPTRTTERGIEANLPPELNALQFYATPQMGPEQKMAKPVLSAPWFDDVPGNGLVFAARLPKEGSVVFDPPLALEQGLGLVANLQLTDLTGLALLLRYDSDARLVPLGSNRIGSRPDFTTRPLNLAAGPEPVPVFLSLAEYLPAAARMLEGVELIKISSAAWRTYASQPAEAHEAVLETLAIGTLVDKAESWSIDEDLLETPETDGWYQITGHEGNKWPVLIDQNAPILEMPLPVPEGESNELLVSVSVRDVGSGLAPNGVEISINGIEVPADLIVVSPDRKRVNVSLGQVPGLTIPNGGYVSVRARAFDQLGQGSIPLEWRWQYRVKTLATGDLRQLTVDGGRDPVWMSDGSGFYFVSKRGGQDDIAHYDFGSGAISWLTETPGSESAPYISADGYIAFVTESGLEIRAPDGVIAPVSGNFTGVTEIGGSWLATTGNRIVDPLKPETTICSGATGAMLTAPRPFGKHLLVTQVIYNHTTWLCDLEAGTMTALSANLGSPDTRDVDATAIGEQAYLYSRDGGAGGIWRRETGARRETLMQANAGGIDRAMAVAPDRQAMLFQSSRSGREEIWLMDFERNVGFILSADRITGNEGEALSGSLEGVTGATEWRLLDTLGRTVEASIEISTEDESFELKFAEALPEGIWQLEMTTGQGVQIRHELIVDRTPPMLELQRVGEQGSGGKTIGVVEETDRFEITVQDVSAVRLVNVSTGELISESTRIVPVQSGTPPIRMVATDSLGSRTEILLNIAIGAAPGDRIQVVSPGDTSVVNTPVITDSQTSDDPSSGSSKEIADRTLWLILLLIALLAVGVGGAAYIRYYRK